MSKKYDEMNFYLGSFLHQNKKTSLQLNGYGRWNDESSSLQLFLNIKYGAFNYNMAITEVLGFHFVISNSLSKSQAIIEFSGEKIKTIVDTASKTIKWETEKGNYEFVFSNGPSLFSFIQTVAGFYNLSGSIINSFVLSNILSNFESQTNIITNKMVSVISCQEENKSAVVEESEIDKALDAVIENNTEFDEKVLAPIMETVSKKVTKEALFGFNTLEKFNEYLSSLIMEDDFPKILSNLPFNLIYIPDEEILFYGLQYVRNIIKTKGIKDKAICAQPIIIGERHKNMKFVGREAAILFLSFIESLMDDRYKDNVLVMLTYKVFLAPYFQYAFVVEKEKLHEDLKSVYDDLGAWNTNWDSMWNTIQDMKVKVEKSKTQLTSKENIKNMLMKLGSIKFINYDSNSSFERNVKLFESLLSPSDTDKEIRFDSDIIKFLELDESTKELFSCIMKGYIKENKTIETNFADISSDEIAPFNVNTLKYVYLFDVSNLKKWISDITYVKSKCIDLDASYVDMLKKFIPFLK